MIGFVKAFFLPTWAKVAGITACILVITTVVVINWDKIKPVFTQMANYFIDSAKKLASTVTKVFEQIKALTGSNIIDKIKSYDGSTVSYEQITIRQNVSSNTISAINSMSLSTSRKVYYLAFVYGGNLVKLTQYPLNYIEAVSVLKLTGLYNHSAGGIMSSFSLINQYSNLGTVAQNLISNLTNYNSINRNLVGIYSQSTVDAGILALSCGATNISQMEVHGNSGLGYYWHFHSGNHAFHVWCGSAY